MTYSIAIFFNYIFCFFSIFYSLKILRKRNYRSILAISNIVFVVLNMIGVYWLSSYLSKSTHLRFDNSIVQIMIFYHTLQSLIFICGMATYRFKLSYSSRIFIKIIALPPLLLNTLLLFGLSIIYQILDYLIPPSFKQFKKKLNKPSRFSTTNFPIVNREYNIIILISSLISLFLSIILVLKTKVVESVSLLFLQSYSQNDTYSIRIQQATEGFNLSLFGLPTIDQLLPLFYFNFSPFFSIYYLLLFLYTNSINIKLKLFFLANFLVCFSISFFVTLTTLAKARFSVYFLSLCIAYLFFFFSKSQSRKPYSFPINQLPHSNNRNNQNSKIKHVSPLAIAIAILSVLGLLLLTLLFTYSITKFSANMTFIEIIQEQLTRTFVVPVSSSYSYFFVYPNVYEHPMFGIDKNLNLFLGNNFNIVSPLNFMFSTSRYVGDTESILVTNFIAYSHAIFGALGLVAIVPYAVITVYFDKKLDGLYLTHPILVFAVYSFVYSVLITAVNVSMDMAVLFFGVWFIPAFALILGKIDLLFKS
jgi:hypothetical protein